MRMSEFEHIHEQQLLVVRSCGYDGAPIFSRPKRIMFMDFLLPFDHTKEMSRLTHIKPDRFLRIDFSKADISQYQIEIPSEDGRFERIRMFDTRFQQLLRYHHHQFHLFSKLSSNVQ